MWAGLWSVEIFIMRSAETVSVVEGNSSRSVLARAGRAPRRGRTQARMDDRGWDLGGLRVVPAGRRRDRAGKDRRQDWRGTTGRSQTRPYERRVPGTRRRERLRSGRSEGPGPTRIREAEARSARRDGQPCHRGPSGYGKAYRGIPRRSSQRFCSMARRRRCGLPTSRGSERRHRAWTE